VLLLRRHRLHLPAGHRGLKVAWIGTCRNPDDGKDYLISYNDCCGKTACGRCLCNTNERERPAYRMGVHNDINWCMSNDSTMFHCTLAAVVGGRRLRVRPAMRTLLASLLVQRPCPRRPPTAPRSSPPTA
jgi:hypothetical protein